MPSFVHFSEKIRLLCSHSWHTKDGARWNARKLGFSHVTSADEREKYRGKSEEGVHPETLRQWREKADRRPDPASIERMVKFINQYLKIREPFSVVDFTDEISVSAFCVKLGYNEDEKIKSEYLIKFMNEGPHNDYVTADKRKVADLVRILRGEYYVYRRDRGLVSEGSAITRLGLVVLGSVPITDHQNETRNAIAARLSIPSKSETRPYFYTGAVAHKHALVSWNFLQEESAFGDVAFFLTDRGNAGRQDVERKGHMLTMAQNGFPLSVSYKVVVRRVNTAFGLNDIVPFLEEAAMFDVPDEDDSIGPNLDP